MNISVPYFLMGQALQGITIFALDLLCTYSVSLIWCINIVYNVLFVTLSMIKNKSRASYEPSCIFKVDVLM